MSFKAETSRRQMISSLSQRWIVDYALSAEWHSPRRETKNVCSLSHAVSLPLCLCLSLSFSTLPLPVSLVTVAFLAGAQLRIPSVMFWIVSSDNTPLCFDWPSLKYGVISLNKEKVRTANKLYFLFLITSWRLYATEDSRKRQKWWAKGGIVR